MQGHLNVTRVCRTDYHFLESLGSGKLMIFGITVCEETNKPLKGSVIQVERDGLRVLTQSFEVNHNHYRRNEVYSIYELKELWIALKESKQWFDCKNPPILQSDPF